MTAANEFMIAEEEQEESSPIILGVPLTPRNIGIAIGVAGAILAGVGMFKLVMPAIAEGSSLNEQITAKQQEIEQQDERLKKVDEARQQLVEAKNRRAAVTALFADEASLDTLMFDIDEQLNQVNANVTDEEQKARITKFEPVQLPDGSDTEVVTDGSLGTAVNGQLRRRKYQIEFEGSFAQARQFLVILERMQPMLVVRNLQTQLLDSNPVVEGEYKEGQFVPASEQPQRRLKMSFDLSALMPLSQEQIEVAAPEDQEASEEAEKT